MANSLFKQVNDIINAKTGGKSQTTNPSMGGIPSALNTGIVPTNTGLTNNLNELKLQVAEINNRMNYIKPYIIDGLDVYAYANNVVAITAGKAYTKEGLAVFNSLASKITIPNVNTLMTIPTTSASVQYITLKGGAAQGFTVTPTPTDDVLIIAKVIVNTVSGAVYDSSDGNNNYIVSGKDIMFNAQFKMDDDTRMALGSMLDTLMAENLVGTLKLSEGLSITNQQDSIKMNSTSMGIYASGVKFADFNKDGVYFFQRNGQILSQYGVSGATVGAIRITPTALQSVNFTSGSTGFRINSNGNAEFNNITARGTIIAQSGTIGKWVIGTNRLTDIQDTTGLAPGINASDGKRYPFYAGATFNNRANAPFRVTASGALFATNATISGNITANRVNATSGLIGGWKITAKTLSGTNTVLGSSGYIRLGAGNNIVQLDSRGVNRIWAGNLVSGLANFRVTQSGVLYATGATITGNITASRISAVTGYVGGWTVQNGLLSGGVMKLYASGVIHTTNFHVGNTGVISATGARLKYATISGTITASAGKIGGWTLGTASLTGGTTVLNNNGNIHTPKFDVSTAGVISAASAHLREAIISGTITASAGRIGGWTIGASTLSGASVTLNKNGRISVGTGNTISVLTASSSSYRLYIGNAVSGSAPFRVTPAGKMYATGAVISGNITASTITTMSGTIGGWTIGATTLKAAGGTITLSAAGNGTIKVGSGADYLMMVGGASPYIQSSNFSNSVVAPKGFKLSANGTMEANDGIFKGKLQCNVFVKNQVNVAGGDLILTTATKLLASATAIVTVLTLDSGVFNVNDIVKVSNSSEYMLITIVSASVNRITVSRGFNSTVAQPYNNKSVIYKVGVKSTTNKGYIELLGTNNVVNIHNVSGGTTTLNDNIPVQMGLLTKGMHTGKYGLYASVAQISGNITASTITTRSGTIGGWTIGSTTITGGSLILGSTGTIHSTNFDLTTTGVLSATSAKLKSATVSGAITCSTLTANAAGTIAGWTITAGKLANGNVGMQPATYPFYAGNSTAASAPFRVDTSGNLTATTVALAGGLTIGTTGSIKTTGKISYTSSASGIWMGYDTSNYKLNIGNATDYLKWTGTNLDIKGNITADNIDEDYYYIDSSYASNLNSFFAANFQAFSYGYLIPGTAKFFFDVGVFTLTADLQIYNYLTSGTHTLDFIGKGVTDSSIILNGYTIGYNSWFRVALSDLSIHVGAKQLFIDADIIKIKDCIIRSSSQASRVGSLQGIILSWSELKAADITGCTIYMDYNRIGVYFYGITTNVNISYNTFYFTHEGGATSEKVDAVFHFNYSFNNVSIDHNTFTYYYYTGTHSLIYGSYLIRFRGTYYSYNNIVFDNNFIYALIFYDNGVTNSGFLYDIDTFHPDTQNNSYIITNNIFYNTSVKYFMAIACAMNSIISNNQMINTSNTFCHTFIYSTDTVDGLINTNINNNRMNTVASFINVARSQNSIIADNTVMANPASAVTITANVGNTYFKDNIGIDLTGV